MPDYQFSDPVVFDAGYQLGMLITLANGKRIAMRAALLPGDLTSRQNAIAELKAGLIERAESDDD